MCESSESAALGPCGWPFREYGNDCEGYVQGVSVNELLPKASIIGDVAFSHLEGNRHVPAYVVEIDGRKIRLAFDEVQAGQYIIASNDADVSVEDLK